MASRCASFVLCLMYLFGPSLSLPLQACSYKVLVAPVPIAWPIAKLLDHVLGANEAHTHKMAELKSFLQFHRTGEEPLRDDEIFSTASSDSVPRMWGPSWPLSRCATRGRAVVQAIGCCHHMWIPFWITLPWTPCMFIPPEITPLLTVQSIFRLNSGHPRMPMHAQDNPLAPLGLLVKKVFFLSQRCRVVGRYSFVTRTAIAPRV